MFSSDTQVKQIFERSTKITRRSQLLVTKLCPIREMTLMFLPLLYSGPGLLVSFIPVVHLNNFDHLQYCFYSCLTNPSSPYSPMFSSLLSGTQTNRFLLIKCSVCSDFTAKTFSLLCVYEK